MRVVACARSGATKRGDAARLLLHGEGEPDTDPIAATEVVKLKPLEVGDVERASGEWAAE